MSAPKNYTVRGMLSHEDSLEVERLLKKHPLWKIKHAREAVARRKFIARIKAAHSK